MSFPTILNFSEVLNPVTSLNIIFLILFLGGASKSLSKTSCTKFCIYSFDNAIVVKPFSLSAINFANFVISS